MLTEEDKNRKPVWACNNYGQYGHDWINCYICSSNYEKAVRESFSSNYHEEKDK